MKFTSIPQNGSSWHDSLPVSFDTELNEPSDVELKVALSSKQTITRRLYGVTDATVDIAPYLRDLSCSPPLITDEVSMLPSQSSQRVYITANGVSSHSFSLFHRPYTISTSLLTTPQESVKHPRGEPILLTLNSPNMTNLIVTQVMPGTTNTTTHSSKASTVPMDIVIPTTGLSEAVTHLRVTIHSGISELVTILYELVEKRSTATSIVWFNSRGGIECYTFPVSLRVSYDAKVGAAGDEALGQYVPLSSATVCYRLCSAYEPAQQMERLAEIVFSPRIFRLDDGVLTPISLRSRHVDFDSHGALRQMTIEVEEPWEGGAK